MPHDIACSPFRGYHGHWQAMRRVRLLRSGQVCCPEIPNRYRKGADCSRSGVAVPAAGLPQVDREALHGALTGKGNEPG
jgi:hypothetical protein